MTKKLYFFDPANKNAFSYFDILEDDAQVPANATTVAPFDNEGKALLNPTWNGTSWVGVDEETWRKSLPDVEHATEAPTATQQALSALTGQVLASQIKLNQHDQQIAALTGELLKQTKATN